MTFNAFCILHSVTKKERAELAWYLAMRRARLLYEMLK